VVLELWLCVADAVESTDMPSNFIAWADQQTKNDITNLDIGFDRQKTVGMFF